MAGSFEMYPSLNEQFNFGEIGIGGERERKREMARDRGKREEISFLRGRNVMFVNGQRTGETNCTTRFIGRRAYFRLNETRLETADQRNF